MRGLGLGLGMGYDFHVQSGPSQNGLVAWYKADTLGLANGAAVNSWADSKGSTPLVVPSGRVGGVFNTVGPNGLPFVSFATAVNAQQSVLARAGFFNPSFMFIAVRKYNGFNNMSWSQNGSDSGTFKSYGMDVVATSATTLADFVQIFDGTTGAGVQFQGSTTGAGVWDVMSLTRDSSSTLVSQYKNGVLAASNNAILDFGNTQPFPPLFRLGARDFTTNVLGNTSTFLPSFVAELLVYNTIDTTALAQSTAYLRSKYNI